MMLRVIMANGSPFPGMNPWLESYWEDVHHSVVHFAAEQLDPRLPEGLITNMRPLRTCSERRPAPSCCARTWSCWNPIFFPKRAGSASQAAVAEPYHHHP